MSETARTNADGVFKTATRRLALVAFPSFFTFCLFSLLIGGDAMNGFTVDDRYFVSSHGTDTEVSKVTYIISLYLGIFTCFAFLLMMIFGIISNIVDMCSKSKS